MANPHNGLLAIFFLMGRRGRRPDRIGRDQCDPHKVHFVSVLICTFFASGEFRKKLGFLDTNLRNSGSKIFLSRDQFRTYFGPHARNWVY